MQQNPEIAGLFKIRTEVPSVPYVGNVRNPMVGYRLTPSLRTAIELPEGENPTRIIIEGTSEDYRVASNGYLIPYYSPDRGGDHSIDGDPEDDTAPWASMNRRNEALIISRSRAFFKNAQKGLGVLRTRQDIDDAIAQFSQMPDETYMQRSAKAGQFKIIVGATVMRLETLGRIITQGNSQGTHIEYDDIRETPLLSSDQVGKLRREFTDLYMFLIDEKALPYLRTVMLQDKTLDRDGILIDLIREIGKPLGIQQRDGEEWVRDHIVNKIGNAMEAIDQVHEQLHKAITKKPTGPLFKQSIQTFIDECGDRFEVKSVDDVVKRLGQYAALCKANAGVRSDDRRAYDEIFRNLSTLNGFFNSENGLLESMRRVGRGSSVEVQELRSLLKRGIAMMERTGSTRVPCNQNAPDIWIPEPKRDLLQDPIQQYLAERFILNGDSPRIEKIHRAASHLPKDDSIMYLKKSFCSLGVLTADLDALKDKIRDHEKVTQTAATTAAAAAPTRSRLSVPTRNGGRN